MRAYSRLGRSTPAELYRALAKDAEANRAGAQPKIAMPVLVLGGEEGLAMVPYEQLRQLADDVTGGVVAGVGHFVVEVRPNELLAILGPFLR